jgi:nicotinate-nucleotide adenylyltransferase
VKIALFGGTFDPPHRGHLAAAEAAQAEFGLDQIHFVPSQTPPHKSRKVTIFAHRYAMVSLACSGNPGFFPSLLEAEGGSEPNYSIVTVRRMLAQMPSHDKLYFLVGADAFLEIPTWREPVALLDACDFIIVSRPGFAIENVAGVIPQENRPDVASAATPARIPMRRSWVHLLTSVQSDVSASEIRRRAARREPLCGLVSDAVAEYIVKMKLYADTCQNE